MTSIVPSQPADASGWAGYFDEFAPTYDATAFGGVVLETVSDREISAVRRGLCVVRTGRILDAGAGTGRITSALVRSGWSVCALDASEAMLTYLRRAHPEVETVVAALGERLPFDDATFDAVSAMRVLKYVDDTDAALRELARVVRPGGRVIVEFANRRSCARFGYGTAPIHLVTLREADAALRAAHLEPITHVAGPRLPQPVWTRARTTRAARLASACDDALATLAGGRRSRLGARSVIVSATRR